MDLFLGLTEILSNALEWAGSGTILGTLAILISIVIYLWSRERSVLSYTQYGERLLGLTTSGLPKDVTVQFRGSDIPRLTRTIVWFWNDGEKPFLRENLVAHDRLRLQMRDDGHILAATVLKQARNVCMFDVSLCSQTQKEIFVAFAFLDKKDGAVIEILHTSEQKFLDLRGTVIGLPHGLRAFGSSEESPGTLQRSFLTEQRSFSHLAPGLSTMLLGAVVMISATLISNDQPNLELMYIQRERLKLFFFWFGFVYVIVGGLFLCFSRRRYPKNLFINDPNAEGKS
jgi:hypothetical protein